jgi:deoxyribodipyrimidine photo-lyase
VQLPKVTTRAWKFSNFWIPTEEEALKKMRHFIDSDLAGYEVRRDIPSLDGTSKLSPYIHFGQLSIRTLWHECAKTDSTSFLRSLIWREFAIQLLFHFPTLPDEPLRPEFKNICWKQQDGHLEAWRTGKTGYPIVDAGMRELLATGWMHNRVRMIVGSFLVKHLLISWQEGQKWFWECLVDADEANNSFGWQWVAGTGADAQPFFRIFNPILQGKKFDPDGAYIRRWIPELSEVSALNIHTPWLCEKPLYGYQKPIIDLNAARKAAIEAYSRARYRT